MPPVAERLRTSITLFAAPWGCILTPPRDRKMNETAEANVPTWGLLIPNSIHERAQLERDLGCGYFSH
jgi:hypothetical protein